MKNVLLSVVCLLTACTTYGERGLAPGVSTQAEVLLNMGEPALRWENPDHSLQLAYRRSHGDVNAYMVYLDPTGRLSRIENVMTMSSFARVQAGMGQDEVLRLLGPSDPAETVYFPARRELDWGWRYCDDWNVAAHFYVLFDHDSGAVRSTMSVRERCGEGDCPCSH